MLGAWNVNVSIDSMPEKVATACAQLNEDLLGAEYRPIAYLGSQIVNGTNHAVLMEQLLITGKDTKNVVLVIFNEQPTALKLTLVNIERVLTGGFGDGAINVDPSTEIPKEAQLALDAALKDFVGSAVEDFAFLGNQIVRGENLFYAATVTPVVPEAVSKVCLITVNVFEGETPSIKFDDILG